MNFCGIVSSVLIVLAGLSAPAASMPAQWARIHWLGLNQISADTNATQFMKIWHLPETTALVDQTLDKLSYWLAGRTTNAVSQALRPLLDDLISSESYLEVFALTNSQPSTFNSQLLLALRLPSSRAVFWQTNLAAVVQVLTGHHPQTTVNGWKSEAAHDLPEIDFSQVNDWSLVGLGQGSREFLPALAASLKPLKPAPPIRYWFQARFDASRLADVFPPMFSSIGSRMSEINLTATGDAGKVLARANVTLAQPWTATLPAWEIPTNYLHDPVTSFTAVRGIALLLAGLPAWKPLQPVTPPDEVFCWSKLQTGGPFVTYFGAPLEDASNQLLQLSRRLQSIANPWLATNGQGAFIWQTNPAALLWSDTFIVAPFLKPVVQAGHDFVVGGLTPFLEGDTAPPPSDIMNALTTSGLVYYQAEQTDVRVDADLFITQLFRMMFKKAQIPATAAATAWLKHIEPLLGVSITEINRTSPKTLALTRHATIGLSALELHLLADWLESPQFPHGLRTFLAPPDK